MKLLPLLFCSAVAIPLAASAAPPQAPELVLIHAESRIEVDAGGQVVAVETLTKLTPEVQTFLADKLREQRFEPPMLDGRPVGGVTYAWQDVCAAPVDGAYRLAVKYRGNGPALDRRHFLIYPRDAERRGVESTWRLEYAINADGTGNVVDLRRTDGETKLDQTFRTAIAQWIRGMEFQPERLDGKPVATQMATEIEFVLGGPRDRRERAHQLKQSNDACQLALDAGDDDKRDVALNSPFKPIAQN